MDVIRQWLLGITCAAVVAAPAVFDSCPYAQMTENDCNSDKSAVFCASLSLRITWIRIRSMPSVFSTSGGTAFLPNSSSMLTPNTSASRTIV